MKALLVGVALAAMSSAAWADLSIGQFADKRATLSTDKGSKAGNPNYIGTLYGGYGWKTGEADEDKSVADVVRDHFVAALGERGIYSGSGSTVVSGTIATLDASAYSNREAEVVLQVIVTRDGSQVFAKTYTKNIKEKTGFFTTNGAMWSTSEHRDEVRDCAEHALDQTLNDIVFDPAFLAAMQSGQLAPVVATPVVVGPPSADVVKAAQKASNDVGCGTVQAVSTGGFQARCDTHSVGIDCDGGNCRVTHILYQ